MESTAPDSNLGSEQATRRYVIAGGAIDALALISALGVAAARHGASLDVEEQTPAGSIAHVRYVLHVKGSPEACEALDQISAALAERGRSAPDGNT